MNFTQLSEKLLEAAHWNINAVGIKRIEAGERRVTVDDLLALAVALDVSPVTLLMPDVDDEVTPVTVTGIDFPAAAVGILEWLRGRFARPGQDQIRIEAWPRWERDQILNTFIELADRRGDGDD
jgi:transcriptional regulator with XRE-family HTH domain